MGYRYRDEDLARVVARWSALGGTTVVRLDAGVLEIRSGWRIALVAWWIAAALATAGAVILAASIYVVLSHDRFLSTLELAGAISPAAVLVAIGVARGRPQVARVDGASCRAGTGERLQEPPVGAALVLARDRHGRAAFDVDLAFRGGARLMDMRSVSATGAAGAKALAVAIAAWLGAELVETTPRETLEALRDADADLRLASPRSRSQVVRDAERSRAREKLETVVEVAVFAVRLLEIV